MANYFKQVSKYPDAQLPMRATADSAGYDFFVAKDIILPSYRGLLNDMALMRDNTQCYTLEETAALTKTLNTRPTLVSTGVKCYLDDGHYLELVNRSSSPLKHWLIVANGVGGLLS